MNNTSITPQKSSLTMEKSAKILQDTPSIAQSFLWELCYDVTEFEDALPLIKPKKLQLHPQMRDVMLAEINMLGHTDKYPRSYDWQQLIQGLSGDEELLWIITKKKTTGENNDTAVGLFSVYLGLKFNQEQLRTEDLKLRQRKFQIFCDNFAKRRFPESSINNLEQSTGTSKYGADSVQRIIDRLAIRGETDRSVYAVVGMPSLKDMDPEKIIADRNEDSRPYASLNDLLEPYVNEKGAFTVIFSVKPCSEGDVQTAFQGKFRLKDLIKPYCEQEINHTEGKSWGTGMNITPRHETVNTSSTEKASFLYGMGRALLGTHKKHRWAKEWCQDLDITTSVTVNEEQRSSSSHEDLNTSSSQTLHITHSDMVYLDSVLEQSLKQLQQAAGGNGFYTNAMIYSDDKVLGVSLARTLRAALSGSQNYMRPMQIIPIKSDSCPDGFFQLEYNMSIADIMQQSNVRQEVMNSEKASFSLLVPDSDIPGGMTLKKSVFYSKPEETEKVLKTDEIASETSNKESIELGKIAYYKDQLGYNNEENKKYRIKHKDIFSHMFIMGAPGGGKSERATYILKHLPTDIRLIVLETAKKEYGDKLSRPGKKLIRYTLGNSAVFPLRINPFFFDPDMNIKQHISALTDALADLLPMEALIGPKIRSAIEGCYTKCNWDIENGCYCGRRPAVYPDMLMFNCEMQYVCNSLSDYGAEVKGNYTGALKNRASIFLDAVYRDIFAFDCNKTIDELFPPDTDVVIEMEDMPPSEINMPAFIITILMHRLRAYRFHQVALDRCRPEDQKDKNKFIIAIEEAHNVLSRDIEASGGDERQSGKGKSLLQLVKKTLAEGRGIGLGMIIIDQAAHAVAQSVLADTNIKIVFGQRDGAEIETIGKSIGLSEEDWKDLQYLENGECIISTIDNPQPFKLSKLTDNEIEQNRRSSSDIQKMPAQFLRPQYFEGRRLLESLYKNGLLSVNEAKQATRYFLEKLCYRQYDLARHIIGKFILDSASQNSGYYKLLEEFLQKDSFSTEKQMASIVQVILELQPQVEADYLLAFLEGRRNSSETLSVLSPDIVLAAIHKVRSALEKDLLAEEDKKILNDKFDELRSYFEVSIKQNICNDKCNTEERHAKLNAWRGDFWKNNTFVAAAIPLFIHLKYNDHGE